MLESPEAVQYMKQIEKQRALAESGAKGEAQRRGFVSPTGTSDIEMALRRSATEPIVQAGQTGLAGMLSRGAEAEKARQYGTSERVAGQEYGTSEREAGQRYGTSEREEGQKYGTSEREQRQLYGTGEREAMQKYGTGEREASQLYAGQMEGYIDPSQTTWGGGKGGGQMWTPYASMGGKEYYGGAGTRERGYEHDYNLAMTQAALNKPKKKKWYESAVGPLAQGVGTAGTYYGMSKLPWG
jgi:hypothetical protein